VSLVDFGFFAIAQLSNDGMTEVATPLASKTTLISLAPPNQRNVVCDHRRKGEGQTPFSSPNRMRCLPCRPVGAFAASPRERAASWRARAVWPRAGAVSSRARAVSRDETVAVTFSEARGLLWYCNVDADPVERGGDEV
jgi:hypothetical protein